MCRSVHASFRLDLSQPGRRVMHAGRTPQRTPADPDDSQANPIFMTSRISAKAARILILVSGAARAQVPVPRPTAVVAVGRVAGDGSTVTSGISYRARGDTAAISSRSWARTTRMSAASDGSMRIRVRARAPASSSCLSLARTRAELETEIECGLEGTSRPEFTSTLTNLLLVGWP